MDILFKDLRGLLAVHLLIPHLLSQLHSPYRRVPPLLVPHVLSSSSPTPYRLRVPECGACTFICREVTGRHLASIRARCSQCAAVRPLSPSSPSRSLRVLILAVAPSFPEFPILTYTERETLRGSGKADCSPLCLDRPREWLLRLENRERESACQTF